MNVYVIMKKDKLVMSKDVFVDIQVCLRYCMYVCTVCMCVLYVFCFVRVKLFHSSKNYVYRHG